MTGESPPALDRWRVGMRPPAVWVKRFASAPDRRLSKPDSPDCSTPGESYEPVPPPAVDAPRQNAVPRNRK